jgi:nickel/cobalt exporter
MRGRRAATWLAVVLALAAGSRYAVRAHDIPNERVDRDIQVILTPGRLLIEYEVSLAELTLAQDLRRLDGPLPGADREALYRRYGDVTGPLNARGLLVTLDGAEVDLAFLGFELAIEEHPRFDFRFEADIPARGRLVVQDTNYSSSEGASRLALRAEGVSVAGYNGPASIDDVPMRPVWMLSDAEERATKHVELEYTPLGSRAVARPSAPPEARPIVTDTVQATRTTPAPQLARLLDRRGRVSWLLLGLLAVGLGAAHAAQPGHGKALIAAAVVGERGGWAAGLILAVLTTLAHMSSVVLIAVGLWLTRATRYASLQGAFTQGAGFAIAAIGLWRLGRHLTGHADAGEVSGDAAAPGLDLRALAGLAVAGGIVPCWDAILLVILAELAGALGLGLFLLAGFSLGMAATLAVVGLAAGRLRGAIVARDPAGRWRHGLGLLSAVALTAIGLFVWIS